MDFTYSNLAFADAYHDYKNYFDVYAYNDIIASGLPNNNILPFRNFISETNFEDIILDIFTARRNDILILPSLSPEEIYKTLCKDKTTFGLIGDANGSLGLIQLLEKQSKSYYVIKNTENRIDSSKPAYYGKSKNCILVNDVITTLKYPQWNTNVCVSSKFCSNYEIQISRIDDKRVKYTIHTDSEIILLDDYKRNPNSKSKTKRVIESPNIPNDTKSVAFQRKRSGDWLQALSSAHTDRFYKLPSGDVQKLNCPLYFCTEDRVAAAFSLALGLETIFHQRGSSVQYLYTTDRYTMNPLDFTCLRDAYKETNINKYRDSLHHAINIYDLFCTIVKQELESDQHLENDILRYIGYIYEYVFINDSLIEIIRNIDFIKQFLEGREPILETEKTIVQEACSNASMFIPELIAHNIHVIPRFPCLNTIQPVSQTGNVGASEIYIVSLLGAMIRSDPVVLNAIEKCVHAILRRSVPSEQLQFHYDYLMEEVTQYRMKGGKAVIPNTAPIISKSTKRGTHMKGLAKTYLAYLRIYETPHIEKDDMFTLPLERMEIGKFSLCTNYDYIFVYGAMQKLVDTYGICKKEFQHHIDVCPDD